MKKKTIILLCLGVACIVLMMLSRKASRGGYTSYHESKAEPPAADSAEWLKRFNSEKSLRHGFQELPPLLEWEPVISRLRQAGPGEREASERLFGEVLADDRKAAEATLRVLLVAKMSRVDSSYYRQEALGYLYTFSEDPAVTREWVKESLPKAYSDPSSGHAWDEFDPLLAENRVDEALAALRKAADAESTMNDKLGHLGRMAEIARLTKRFPIHEQAVEEMKALALKLPAEKIHGSYTFHELLQELVLLKDWSTIRKIGNQYRASYDKSGFLSMCLTATYHLDGPAAFLKEMRACPGMGITNAKDYMDLLINRSFEHEMGIGEMTVRSLMDAGEKDKARVTLEYLLALETGDDAFYRLALEFFPDRAEAMFQALRPYNPYQERPLIWLGEIALGKNDLVRARECVDQAIALDPSDGEQGKFTRMQVYDVLSRILRAGGDAEKADFFSEVMKAIRRGEEADDYLGAGLTQEAIRRYQEALGHFEDAYCLQSRLAKTLMKAGKEEEAMKHFEKAFELMPVSFGPVESHCFGCERIFEGDRVQEIAVKTFNRIIESSPKNPRTFYLLGLVLEEMNQPQEAATAMRKALELDPMYYNCARRLVGLVSENPETATELSSLRRQLAGMAPYPDLQQIYQSRSDLRQLWQDAQTPPPCPLKLEPLPLPFDPAKAATADSGGIHYHEGKMDPLDGWSTEELLRDNGLLRWLDYL